jgi:hypothetical protein
VYGYNGAYWFQGSELPLPLGVTHGYYNVPPLGGYANILGNGMTSLPWQSPDGY